MVTETRPSSSLAEIQRGVGSSGERNSVEGFGGFVMFDRGGAGSLGEVPGRSGQREWRLSAFLGREGRALA